MLQCALYSIVHVYFLPSNHFEPDFWILGDTGNITAPTAPTESSWTSEWTPRTRISRLAHAPRCESNRWIEPKYAEWSPSTVDRGYIKTLWKIVTNLGKRRMHKVLLRTVDWTYIFLIFVVLIFLKKNKGWKWALWNCGMGSRSCNSTIMTAFWLKLWLREDNFIFFFGRLGKVFLHLKLNPKSQNTSIPSY